MNILMITSEAVPYAKTGGLADVVTALSEELASAGHAVKVLLPLYGFISEGNMELQPWTVTVASSTIETSCRVAKLKRGNVEWIFLKHPLFSERPGIYGTTSSAPYTDNLVRFNLLSLAVFEVCRKLNWYPDIFHCHDWTTGLVPLLLEKRSERAFRKAASVMTIHNLGYQGKFSKHDVHLLGIEADEILFPTEGRIPGREKVNLLATGIRFADKITTVSKTYAQEIQNPDFGEGLDSLLAARAKDVIGILNGVDYSEWNPEADAFLPLHYSFDAQGNKDVLKRMLQQEMGLEESPGVPIIGMISRLADQKGFRELCAGDPTPLSRIAADYQVQIVIVGTGDREIERSLLETAELFPNVAVRIEFSNYLAHAVEAGSDFFLMPSRYEPCGLNQIYSLRYGTIPIVRRTGGLADTVEQFSPQYETGTGIVFDLMSGEAIYQAVGEVEAFTRAAPEIRREVRKRCMEMRFPWKASADLYAKTYEQALTHKGASHE